MPSALVRLAPAAVLLASATAAATERYVTDVQELYAAVNGGAPGDVIILAPGTYPLAPGGVNGGRLELKPGMRLVGPGGEADLDRWETGEGDSELDAIIDAEGLPDTSFVRPGGGVTGALRAGPDNAVSGLVLRRARKGLAFLECDLLPASGGMKVTIERNLIFGNQRGIDLRNFGTAFSGRTSEFLVAENVLRDNTVGEGQGLRMVHNRGCAGAAIHATLRGNRIHGNAAGVLAESLGAGGDEYVISSTENLIHDNHVGMWLSGGVGGEGTVLRLVATGDAIFDNARPEPPDDGGAYPIGGGIVAIGGEAATGFGPPANGCTVTLELVDVTFRSPGGGGNRDSRARRDLTGIGGYGYGGIAPGSDNVLEVIDAGSRPANLVLRDSIPDGANEAFLTETRP